MRRFCILWASVLLLGGCAIKQYERSEAKMIVLKTPRIKFADTGYIRHKGDALQLELYAMGQPVKQIAINHLICVDEGCMSKSSFNAEYLSAYYPDDLLLHVSRGEAIFGGEGQRDKAGVLLQQLATEHYDITYRVSAQETYFKDRKNAILIRLKTIP